MVMPLILLDYGTIVANNMRDTPHAFDATLIFRHDACIEPDMRRLFSRATVASARQRRYVYSCHDCRRV